MSLKLKAKNFLFKVLDVLPSDLGHIIYHWFQDQFVSNNLNLKISSSQNSFLEVIRMTGEVNIDLKNSKIIEIGSGWLPLMPYFFKYFGGADEIRTYDLNRHYNRKNLEELNQVFFKKFEIETKFSEAGEFSLPNGIFYFPKKDLAIDAIDAADIIFSRFVLEHVNPIDIKKMHLNFIENSPKAYIIHLISPSDHRAYLDSSLSLQDFLKYNKDEWDKMQTKFDYHNRLRLPQYLELFKTLGYEIVYLDYNTPPENSKEFQKFRNLMINADFENFSEEELMAGSINLIIKYRSL